MLGRIVLQRNLGGLANARKFATASKPCSYKEKTFKEAWLSDTGAYPVMSVIVFAGVFCLTYGVWVMGFSPDARISKGARKSIFRGELKGQT